MRERSVASTEVTIRLPAEALREWRASFKDDHSADALGNERWKKAVASAAMRRMGADLHPDAESISVAPDGSLEGDSE